MKPNRKLNRRSFLVRVGGGLAVSGGALWAFTRPTSAGQVTDRDPTDSVGRGRGGGTGVTDQDFGVGADPAGRGRGMTAPQGTGVTDSDTGASADPPGRGRGPNRSGLTADQAARCQIPRDMDATISDAPGQGRGQNAPREWSHGQQLDRTDVEAIYAIPGPAPPWCRN